MAGTITAQLLAEVRAQLDEASATFWQDTDIYQSLTDGQREYVSLILAQYKAKVLADRAVKLPEVLRVLLKAGLASTTFPTATTSIALPADFLYHVSFLMNVSARSNLLPTPIREYSPQTFFQNSNSLLNTDQYAWIDAGNINWSPAINGGQITLNYISKPTDITASIDPVLPQFGNAALVRYAFADCLRKDQRTQEAEAAYGEFLQMIKYI